MNKKKLGLILGLSAGAVAVIAAVLVWVFFFRQPEMPEDPNEIAYVTPVADLVSGSGLGLQTRFSGVVEPQQTLSVQKDESKKLDQIYVSVGQHVEAGDPLFSYDTDDLSLQLQEAELQLESLKNRVVTLGDQIESLEKDKKNAPSDEKLHYTLQIQSLELEIKTTEYDQSAKAKEIDQLKASLENADVAAEISGTVREINENGGMDPNYYGGEGTNAFITILATGQYRVKATVTELNLSSVTEGMAVNVLSRVDPAQSWTGVVERIDYEPVKEQNPYMSYGGEDAMTPASKYNFYILLDDYEGLILGQHVYVETGAAQKSGLWLPGAYIFTDETGSWVWAENGANRMEKRAVSLGGYDPMTDEYEILDGLTEADAIAYHHDMMHSGMYAVYPDEGMDMNAGMETGGMA